MDKPPKEKKVYYSSRGGARSKGISEKVRANAVATPLVGLEAPLPHDTSSHYARGGIGNEWDYVVEEGVLERVLEYEAARIKELRWAKPATTGLRGGARIPKKKDKDAKAKVNGKSSFINLGKAFKKGEPVPSVPSAVTDVTTGDEKAKAAILDIRNEYTPESDCSDIDPSLDESFTGLSISTGASERYRSTSFSSDTSEGSIWTPETSPVTQSQRKFSFVAPGVLLFKPDPPTPLADDFLPIPPKVGVAL